MNYIYLIGTTGAARTSCETMASAFEQASGYRRCTQEEYHQRMRQIQALDLPAQAPLPSEPTEPDHTTGA